MDSQGVRDYYARSVWNRGFVKGCNYNYKSTLFFLPKYEKYDTVCIVQLLLVYLVFSGLFIVS